MLASLLREMDSDQTYLGDGVVASYDGNGIEPRTGRHDGRCLIYLEPEAIAALIAFWRAKTL